MNKSSSFSRLLLFYAVFATFFSVAIFFIFYIYTLYINSLKESKEYIKNTLEISKEYIKKDFDNNLILIKHILKQSNQSNEAILKNQILTTISKIKDDISVFTLDGYQLMENSNIKLDPLSCKQTHNLCFESFSKSRDILKKKEFGFIIKEQTDFFNISYVLYFEPLNWIISTNHKISKNVEFLKIVSLWEKFSSNLILLIIILIIIFLAIFISFKKIKEIFLTDISKMFKFFEPNKKEMQLIDRNDLLIDELKNISMHINKMMFDRKRIEDKVKKITAIDFLTNTYQRLNFLGLANKIFSNYKSSGVVFSLIIVKIDNLDEINKRYNLKVGDFVVKKVAEVIKNYTDFKDLIGRIDGNEFAILYPNKNSEETKKIAQKLKAHIAKLSFAISENESLKINSTLSVTESSKSDKKFDDTLKRVKI